MNLEESPEPPPLAQSSFSLRTPALVVWYPHKTPCALRLLPDRPVGGAVMAAGPTASPAASPLSLQVLGQAGLLSPTVVGLEGHLHKQAFAVWLER